MNSGKVILGVLAGLAAGALMGVLFAPDKGSESMSRITKKGDEYLNSVRERFNSILDAISGQFNGGKVEASDFRETSKNNSKESKREVQPSAG